MRPSTAERKFIAPGFIIQFLHWFVFGSRTESV
jgi:hypothetical protein